MTETREIEFPDACDISMDKGIRSIVEHMFDNDNDAGELQVVVNKGLENEAEVTLLIRIKSINNIQIAGESTDG
jgi:hypothetical protein